jgi:hypothetical protein
MFAKVIAGSFIAVWLLLLGIEFSQDSGFFDYSDPDMDKSMEGTLASLGESIKASDSSQLTASRTLSAQPEVVSTSYDLSSHVESVSSFVISDEIEYLKGRFKIHKLHQVFLI